MRALRVPVIALLGATACAVAPAAAFDVECREVVPITVTLVRACSAGQEDVVTAQLATEAPTEAVRQVIGVRVASSSSHSVRDEDGKTDERFKARIVAQSSGFATVAVLGHRILDADGGRQVNMSFSARVCIPREPRLVRQVVTLAAFEAPDGRDAPRVRAAVGQVFSTSEGYSVSQEAADDGFADIVLSAKIHSVSVSEVDASPNTGPGRRVTVNGELTARRSEDGEVVTQAIADFRIFSAARFDETAVPQYVAQRFSQAARELHDRLLRSSAGTQPLPASVYRGQVGGPKW